MFDFLEPWGLLPLAVPLFALASSRLAGSLARSETLLEHLAATAVVGMALVHLLVAGLGTLDALTSPLFFAMLFVVGGAALGLPSRGPRWVVSRWFVLAGVLALIPVLVAVLAAWASPVHLPFVNLVIQDRGFSGIPTSWSSAHGVELGTVAVRLLIPNDRLVELGQVPYGIAGAVLTSAIASRLSGTKHEGLSAFAGALWLFVPTVLLELPSSAVDLGAAATFLGAVFFLLLSPLGWRTGLLGAVSLGLFLGSTASAPLSSIVVLAALAWRALPRERGLVALVVGVTALMGASFLGLPRSAIAMPTFELTLRDLGLPLLVALPLSIVALIRGRSGLIIIALAGAILTRSSSLGAVLAVGALLLALAFSELESWQAPKRVFVAATALAAAQLFLSVPGLGGDDASDQRRATSLDAAALSQRIETDETVAFEEDFDFPAMLFTPRRDYRVVAIPKMEPSALTDWARAHRVRFLAVGANAVDTIASGPWRRAVDCHVARCAVFELDEALISTR